jgi:hypothetical protein
MNYPNKEFVVKKFKFQSEGSNEFYYFSSLPEEILKQSTDEGIASGAEEMAVIIFGIHKFEIVKVGTVKMTTLIQIEDFVSLSNCNNL